MKILFITAHRYLPQMYGGLQSSTHELCLALLDRGHEVAVLASLVPGGWLALQLRIKNRIKQRLSLCVVSRANGLGYPVWYAKFPWDAVPYVARVQMPDLIVVMAFQAVRMALAAQPTAIPILLQLQDVEFRQHGGRFDDLGEVPCVANSRFTAERYRSLYGINPSVIYPLVAADKYRTGTTRENITFINPHPQKGRDVAIEIARRCPDIPFTFVEGWPLSPGERRDLAQNLAALPNITFLPPCGNMREVYAKCRILLVPSIWEEGYGRVVTEAQVSGIPVIGSTRGGLPEAIGPGGMLLDPDKPIGDWIATVHNLWQNDSQYAQLSAAAQAHANRREMTLAYQISAWEKALHTAAMPRTQSMTRVWECLQPSTKA